jgi:hypothetical protein
MYLSTNKDTIIPDIYSSTRGAKFGSNSVIPTDFFRGVPPPV